MCFDKNKPHLKDLKSAEDINSHGGGMAWIEDGKVKYKKGIDSTEIWKIIKTIELPFIVHFRIKSIGEIIPELTHPFPISEKMNDDLSGECDKVLFHNGTYRTWDDDLLEVCKSMGKKIPDGELSDSKALAFLCAALGENYLKLIDTESRFTIFDKNGFRNIGKFVEASNGMCSNDIHVKDVKITTYNSKLPIKKDEEERIKCQYGDNYNIYKNNQLLRTEDKDGKTIHKYESNFPHFDIMSSLDNKIDETTIIKEGNDIINDAEKTLKGYDIYNDNLTNDEKKKLCQSLTNRILRLEASIKTLENNLIDYAKDPHKFVTKIKSTLRRIKTKRLEKTNMVSDMDYLWEELETIDPGLKEDYEDQIFYGY